MCSVVALVTLFVAACTTAEVNRFTRVPSERVEHAYIRPGADFSSYTAVLPGQVAVWAPTGAPGLDADRLALLQTRYVEALAEALAADGAYAIVTTRAPGVLELQTQFIDLRSTVDPETVRVLQLRYSFPLQAGRATLVAELVDSTSGQVLAHIADGEGRAEYGSVIAAQTPESETRRTLARWAGVLREFLDEARQ